MTNWKQISFLMAGAFFFAGWVQTAAFAGPLEDGNAAFGRKDYQTALKCWKPLAEQGNMVAQTSVGVMYYRGQGVKRDYAEAVNWLRKAAEQGYFQAQRNLGIFYFDEKTGKQDYAEAAKWYRKAAEQGDDYAQDNLGWQYTTGHGVTQDLAEGEKWFLMAARQGNFDSMTHLLQIYEFNHTNDPESYFWASLLANSNAAWNPSRDLAASYLTPQQKAELDKRVQEWKPVPSPAPSKQ